MACAGWTLVAEHILELESRPMRIRGLNTIGSPYVSTVVLAINCVRFMMNQSIRLICDWLYGYLNPYALEIGDECVVYICTV